LYHNQKQNIMKLTKKQLQNNMLDFTNSREDLIEVELFSGHFQLWLNGVIVKSTKTLKPIQDKLNFLTSI